MIYNLQKNIFRKINGCVEKLYALRQGIPSHIQYCGISEHYLSCDIDATAISLSKIMYPGKKAVLVMHLLFNYNNFIAISFLKKKIKASPIVRIPFKKPPTVTHQIYGCTNCCLTLVLIFFDQDHMYKFHLSSYNCPKDTYRRT